MECIINGSGSYLRKGELGLPDELLIVWRGHATRLRVDRMFIGSTGLLLPNTDGEVLVRPAGDPDHPGRMVLADALRPIGQPYGAGRDLAQVEDLVAALGGLEGAADVRVFRASELGLDGEGAATVVVMKGVVPRFGRLEPAARDYRATIGVELSGTVEVTVRAASLAAAQEQALNAVEDLPVDLSDEDGGVVDRDVAVSGSRVVNIETV